MATFDQIIASPSERDAVERILRSAGFTHALIGDDDDRANLYFAVPSTELDAVDPSRLSQELTLVLPGRKAGVTSVLGEGIWTRIY